MMPYARVFTRGFLIVACVALNTRQIAAGNYGGAFVVGAVISGLWWSNSSKKREDVTGAGVAYAFGAACGTVFGMWLGA